METDHRPVDGDRRDSWNRGGNCGHHPISAIRSGSLTLPYTDKPRPVDNLDNIRVNIPVRIQPPTDDPSSSPTNGDVSRAAYLTQVEQICLQDRHEISAPPDRSRDPQAFGRWLWDITTGNQNLFNKLVNIKRPVADEDILSNLYASRQHANDLHLRSASAFENYEQATGEQFLDAGMKTEANFRESAKSYGFSICTGSDTPGR